MKYRTTEILAGALRRPDLAIRFLRGRLPSEFDLEELTRYILRSDPVIVEAGAFDGKDTRAFAEHWPSGHVYAFEPLPLLAQRARANTNHLRNVTLIESALGVDESRQAYLYTFGADSEAHGSSSILKPGDHLEVAPEIKFGQRILVKALPLDEWHASVGSPAIDLMWLDLQGAELRVLAQGEKALAKTHTLHIEVSRRPLYEGGATFQEVKSFLLQRGFSLRATRMPVRSGNAIFSRTQ